MIMTTFKPETPRPDVPEALDPEPAEATGAPPSEADHADSGTESQDPGEDAVGGLQDEVPSEAARRQRLTPHTPAQIVARAHEITTGYGGMCLKFTRICANIAAVHGSAKDAWAAAQHKHTRGYADAPAGAFLFMSHPKSRYGHVAVYLGDGTMRTTNSTTSRIHTDRVSKWVGWGYRVQGWSEDLNGVRVPGLKPVRRGGGASPQTSDGGSSGTTAAVLGRGATGAAVGRLQRALNKVFPAYSKLAVDSVYGPLTAGVVGEFQRRAGLRVTGDVDRSTRESLARHGVRF